MTPSDSFENPKDVLRRYGLKPSRRHSQNFLTARWAIDAIADASVPSDIEAPRMMEFGPGAGTLTAALLARGAHVIAIEKDLKLIELLQAEFAAQISAKQLRIKHGDAARASITAPHLVGNLPYAITGKILRNIVEHRGTLVCATIMIQREVGDRLRAAAGNKSYGLLSVMVQNNFKVGKVCDVGAGNFFPPPKVDSTVVQLRRRAQSLTPHTRAFEAVVRTAFGQRRKTLRRALRANFDLDEAALERCAQADLDLSRRAETLSIEEFGHLTALIDAPENRVS